MPKKIPAPKKPSTKTPKTAVKRLTSTKGQGLKDVEGFLDQHALAQVPDHTVYIVMETTADSFEATYDSTTMFRSAELAETWALGRSRGNVDHVVLEAKVITRVKSSW